MVEQPTDSQSGEELAHALLCGLPWQQAEAVVESLLSPSIREIGKEIAALRIPQLAGVVLGGGYGRGEGGIEMDGTPRLCNDLDFFAVTEREASARDIEGIRAALRPISERWASMLGVEVDFAVKTPWRLWHDRKLLMMQELVRGFREVTGRPGAELLAKVEPLPPEALPASEAARLLANRGAGLLLARDPGRDASFVARNLVKAVLGAGDARLIARGGYHWRAEARAQALGDLVYARALAWKYRPAPEAPFDAATAERVWLAAADDLAAAVRGRRSARSAARWIVRRRTLGPLRTFGLAPEVRVLFAVTDAVRGGGAMGRSLRHDWEVFN